MCPVLGYTGDKYKRVSVRIADQLSIRVTRSKMEEEGAGGTFKVPRDRISNQFRKTSILFKQFFKIAINIYKNHVLFLRTYTTTSYSTCFAQRSFFRSF